MKPTRSNLPAAILMTLFSATVLFSCGQEKTLGETCLPLYKSISQSQGIDPGEADYESWAHLKIPPLHPQQALERFELEEGFRIEVVAHEPMVIDPIAMDIDADGRLWVINMPSYNISTEELPVRYILENTGERTEEREQALREQIPEEPLGSVVVLEDTNGDGRMDTHRVFYEGLHLPRAIKVLGDGILVGEPPNLWFIRDTTGDGRGDHRELVSSEYETPRSPQSGPHSLFRAMDNRMHNSHFPSLRRTGDGWQTHSFEALGQWGMSQDDWGRLYSSSNSWPLHIHMVPYGYSERHPLFDLSTGLNTRIAPNGPVWPAHPTGVNRGYRVGDVTREDGTLKIGAGISSTVIYRGDQFGETYRGNAFTPVGSGNLIKRSVVESDPAEIDVEAHFAYEGREFLASTDERFRPVNIYNAPDGSIYVVDIYRGLYDYVLWVTDYLGEYTLEHELDEPTGQYGRIYRIVRNDRNHNSDTPRFSEMGTADVAGYLSHTNGLLRDLAQQVLTECSPQRGVPILESLVQSPSAEPYTRLQALWTLEGYDRSVYSSGQLTGLALQALEDDHPRVRATAVRILEQAVARDDSDVLARLEELSEGEEAPYVQLQLLASLGESPDERALYLMATILDEHAESPYFQEMALTGVYLRETQFAGILRREYGWSEVRGEAWQSVLSHLSEAETEVDDADLAHLTGAQRALYERGSERYTTCMTCHGAGGQGVEGIGSALAGSEWVLGDPGSLLRIVMHGFDGGAAERGENIPNDMPGHGFMSDVDIAAIVTYLRQSWGNDASPVEPDDVARIRQETSNRRDLWTPDELRALQ